MVNDWQRASAQIDGRFEATCHYRPLIPNPLLSAEAVRAAAIDSMPLTDH
jgi:hypothetical protein